MTAEQAAAELNRMCRELGRRMDSLSPEQTNAFLRVLKGMPYEQGRAAVTHLVNTWSRDSLPPPGALTKASRDASFEGEPNAGAYSQNAANTPWYRQPAANFLLWRQTKIESWDFPFPIDGEDQDDDPADIAERRYWAFAHDKDYRRRCEAAWRREWEETGAAVGVATFGRG